MARSLEQRLEQDQSSMEEYYKACHTDREHLLADFAQAAEDQLRARLTLLPSPAQRDWTPPRPNMMQRWPA